MEMREASALRAGMYMMMMLRQTSQSTATTIPSKCQGINCARLSYTPFPLPLACLCPHRICCVVGAGGIALAGTKPPEESRRIITKQASLRPRPASHNPSARTSRSTQCNPNASHALRAAASQHGPARASPSRCQQPDRRGGSRRRTTRPSYIHVQHSGLGAIRLDGAGEARARVGAVQAASELCRQRGL